MNRIRNLGMIIICAFVFIKCADNENTGNGNSPRPNPNESVNLADLRQEIALQVANHHILPGFDILNHNAKALKEKVDEFSLNPTETSLSDVRTELKTMWMSWQNVAIFQFGPTETNTLRTAINTYPSNLEKIEQNINAANWNLGTIDNQSAEGLPAIDYLINYKMHESDANLESFLNNQVRLDYLIAITDDITSRIEDVSNEWKEMTFLSSFISNTANGTDVGSALGQLINSIDVHFQRYLRDGKVAIPAGVRSAGIPRPTATEGYFGGYSRSLLEMAIKSYIDLFSGKGLDGTIGTSVLDYLTALDQQPIGDDILASLESNLNKIRILEENLALQIEQDNDSMIQLFIDLQNTITLIKSDMSSVIGITITNQDNDGD